MVAGCLWALFAAVVWFSLGVLCASCLKMCCRKTPKPKGVKNV